MKSLSIQYRSCVITITGIPDHLDLVSVERACRYVCDNGANPYPDMLGRIDYHVIIRAGLDAGLLENPETKELK